MSAHKMRPLDRWKDESTEEWSHNICLQRNEGSKGDAVLRPIKTEGKKEGKNGT